MSSFNAPFSAGVLVRMTTSTAGKDVLEEIKQLPKALVLGGDNGRQKETAEPAQGVLNYHLASQKYLEDMVHTHALPPIEDGTWWRRLRYDFFSAYRTLHTAAILLNAIGIAWAATVACQGDGHFTSANASDAVAANLCVATLMRHEHFINLLFRLCTSPPLRRAPLALRCRAAKIYSYGGLHSGCGMAAFFWYLFFAILLVMQQEATSTKQEFMQIAVRPALVALTSLMLVLFGIIITMAHPALRARYHNHWELSHRYAGWLALGVIWAQTILLVLDTQHRDLGRPRAPFAILLCATPAFWFLVTITTLFGYPWLRLRRRRVTAERLSDHAIRLHFATNGLLPTCVGTRLSTNPFADNHGFATIPNSDGAPGFSVLVSNAGDWTSRLIQRAPTHVYTRGAFTFGVLRVALLFKPVVMVATGSGIGPCLSFLQVHPAWPVRILWSTRNPERTYGLEVMDRVLISDPQAVIIDGKRFGNGFRPDLTRVAFALYRESAAEAVVIISNPRATTDLVGRLEKRGVPAFGAIFDS